MPRIVSLISSATEIVNALGQIGNLVGRSHECDYPEAVKALPVCTRPRIAVDASSAEIDRMVKESARDSISIYDVFEDVIERLEPTHILTQIQCEVCAVSLRDVEAAMARGMKGRPKIVSLRPDSLEEIWSDMRRVAEALGIPRRGEELIVELQGRMDLGIAATSPASTYPTSTYPTSAYPASAYPASAYPTVACIEWMEPLMAAGNWTPELIAMAGGRNLFGEAGRHSPWMRWEDLVAADPDVIILAPCGFDLARTQQEIYWMTDRVGWSDLRARVYLADGNQYFNRPGPRVVETLRMLAEILHPERFEPSLRGIGWREL